MRWWILGIIGLMFLSSAVLADDESISVHPGIIAPTSIEPIEKWKHTILVDMEIDDWVDEATKPLLEYKKSDDFDWKKEKITGNSNISFKFESEGEASSYDIKITQNNGQTTVIEKAFKTVSYDDYDFTPIYKDIDPKIIVADVEELPEYFVLKGENFLNGIVVKLKDANGIIYAETSKYEELKYNTRLNLKTKDVVISFKETNSKSLFLELYHPFSDAKPIIPGIVQIVASPAIESIEPQAIHKKENIIEEPIKIKFSGIDLTKYSSIHIDAEGCIKISIDRIKEEEIKGVAFITSNCTTGEKDIKIFAGDKLLIKAEKALSILPEKPPLDINPYELQKDKSTVIKQKTDETPATQ
ncbi:hypothetical protein KKA47_02475 [bacterium]|nr:hypothetical protein [bacterium]